MDQHDRPRCYLRNIVHATYREIRHVGPPADHDAKLHVADDTYASAATFCSQARRLLKTTRLFRETAGATTVGEVLQPYYGTTRLHLEDVIVLFGRDGWATSYGGTKWAAIASIALELSRAVGNEDDALALELCEQIRGISHNNGSLVPTARDWHAKRYLQEKWPQLCE